MHCDLTTQMTYYFLKVSFLEDLKKKKTKTEKSSCSLFGARNPKFSFGSNSHQDFPEGCMGLHFQKNLKGFRAHLIVKSDLD